MKHNDDNDILLDYLDERWTEEQRAELEHREKEAMKREESDENLQ